MNKTGMASPYKPALAILVLVAMVSCTFAQTDEGQAREWFDKAEAFIEYGDYQQALPLYEKVLETDPENANFNYLVGMCYLMSPSDQDKSIPHFRKAVQSTTSRYKVGSFKEGRAPDDAYYYMAYSLHLGYELDSALFYYEKFKPLIEELVPDLLPEVDRQEKMCRNAKRLLEDPIKIQIKNLGSTINTSYPEYGPVISADEEVMIFTSLREGSTGGLLTNDGYFYEDIYVSRKENGTWSAPIGIGAPINTSGHEATLSISADGQRLYIYKGDYEDGNIYVSQLTGENWSAPEKLGPTVSTPYTETHASLSPDGSRLYFTSDRPGGYGGLDIYMVKKLPNGQWGMAQNLGPLVNSKYDEDGPSIHADGTTLYFSSNSERSMGGFDVFYTTLNEDETWSEPVNMGYPLNTTNDDLFFVMMPSGKRAYYSSAAEDSYGDRDIYMINFAENEEVGLTVMKGTLQIGENGEVPEDAKITVKDHVTGEVLGIYKPNKKTGKYLFILPPGNNYTITFEAQGYLTHAENLFVPPNSTYKEVNKPIRLSNMEIKDKIELKNLYFEYNSAKLTKDSEKELNKLYRFLKKNPTLVISVQGHTDNKGSDAANMTLSQKRTESVKKYLEEKGILGARIRAQGYGSTRPIAINNNPDGTDNPDGRALNRRIEIIIIGGESEFNVVKIDEVPENLKIKR
ncbi:MAG: PD40 domain-containing protein [Flavobacteriales bacterium]|nr:PD40 domain-containing protein [Flavobacteriales bacterium]